MNNRYIFTSLTRITDLKESEFKIQGLKKSNWANGDYVVGEVTKPGGSLLQAELSNGRMMELMNGDLIIGALGIRHATLEATGSWEGIGKDGKMHLLTSAGLIGKLTSKSAFIPNLIELQYQGHVMINNDKTNMSNYVPELSLIPFDIPVVLLVGTSMSAGKTTAARVITRQLKGMGLRVTGAKLTGAGRFRDILSIKDAGADSVFDFVDVGLPSSICPQKGYERALEQLLSLIAETNSDVAVIEIGASPLEPYNGDLAVESIRNHVKITVLCASDPYAVLGVMKSFEVKPSIVSGPAANTIGGIELIQKLCGIEALNLIEQENLPKLRSILKEKLNLESKT